MEQSLSVPVKHRKGEVGSRKEFQSSLSKMEKEQLSVNCRLQVCLMHLLRNFGVLIDLTGELTFT